jgi:hypothetical protein
MCLLVLSGDKYENGVITPRPPPVHYSRPSRLDRNRNYRDSPPQQGNYQNRPPQQGNFQTYHPQQDGRGYAPQQNYAPGGQDARGYGPPGGFQSQAPPYQGHANRPGLGQDYYNPQENRNFSQGQGGDFRPGGPSSPGTYGQPSAPGNYGQPPSSAYPGGNQGAPHVNPNYGGNNSQGTGPAYGGDNWQNGSGQYPRFPSRGEGNWQV